MKAVIIFGGSGYIGSTVSKQLLDKGFKVVNFDLNDSPAPVLKYDKNYKLIQYNLRYPLTYFHSLDEFLENDEVVGAIHFAAFKSLPDSLKNPWEYYDNNIKSLLHALEFCHFMKCPTFIFSSSAAVYDKVEGGVKESYASNQSDNPYGYSKIIGERIVEDVCKVYGIRGISLRYFNPIGDTEVSIDNSDSLFGNIRKCITNNEPLIIFGSDYPTRDGTCVRDYIDIRDLAKAHIMFFTEELKEAEYNNHMVFNVGTGKGTTVKELAEAMQDLYPNFRYEFGPKREGDSVGGFAETFEIWHQLGFKCDYSIRDSLKTIFID